MEGTRLPIWTASAGVARPPAVDRKLCRKDGLIKLDCELLRLLPRRDRGQCLQDRQSAKGRRIHGVVPLLGTVSDLVVSNRATGSTNSGA